MSHKSLPHSQWRLAGCLQGWEESHQCLKGSANDVNSSDDPGCGAGSLLGSALAVQQIAT